MRSDPLPEIRFRPPTRGNKIRSGEAGARRGFFGYAINYIQHRAVHRVSGVRYSAYSADATAVPRVAVP